mmetsp:Transcript_68083/g.191905  ORF Transcript_68083/g.191905 Transcript_68083/m.191905 type:complete len:386 (+) Transcript_68083:1008-2165(+)
MVAVAGCATGDPVPAVLPLALSAEPAAVGARRRDDGVRSDGPRLVGRDLERPDRGVQADDGVVPHLRKKAPGLALHDVDHLPAVLARHPRVVLDVDPLHHELAAHRGGNDEGAQVGPGGVDGRGHAGGATADDDDLLDGPRRAVAVQAARVVRVARLLLLELLDGRVLLPPLELLPQLLRRRGLQVWASTLRVRGLVGFGLAGAAGVVGLRAAWLRLWRLAVLLLQEPNHGAEVLAVLREDLVDALRGGLGRVMLLIEHLQRLARDLDVVAVGLLDELPGPLLQPGQVAAVDLMFFLPPDPELERGQGPDLLVTGGLAVPSSVHLPEVRAAGIPLRELLEVRGDHAAGAAGHAVVLDDDRSPPRLCHHSLEVPVRRELLDAACRA